MKKSHLRKWNRYLTRKYGKDTTNRILSDAKIRYEDLLLTKDLKSNPNKNRLTKMVFPILAVYQALKNEHLTQEQALRDAENLLCATFFSTQLTGIRYMNRVLSDPFRIIKPVLLYMIKYSDLPSGQMIKQNDKNCFAINVYQCFIHDTLLKNAPELTAVFCATDDWLSAAMPKIEWKRTQTIGCGGEMCDFCWCRRKSNR